MEGLGINLPGFIAQLINFILFMVLLRVAIFPPVMRMLDARAEKIKESMDRATALQEQAVAAQAEFEAQIAQARKESQEIVARAMQTADRIKNDAEADGRRQTEALIARAQAEIQLERDRAIADLRKEFADITVTAAERVINQELDKAKHLDLINGVLADSKSFKVN